MASPVTFWFSCRDGWSPWLVLETWFTILKLGFSDPLQGMDAGGIRL